MKNRKEGQHTGKRTVPRHDWYRELDSLAFALAGSGLFGWYRSKMKRTNKIINEQKEAKGKH